MDKKLMQYKREAVTTKMIPTTVKWGVWILNKDNMGNLEGCVFSEADSVRALSNIASINRDANKIMNGIIGKRYLRNLTSKNSPTRKKFGNTHERTSMSVFQLGAFFKVLTKAYMTPPMAVIPKGIPRAQKKLCFNSYTKGMEPMYCIVYGIFPAVLAISASHVLSAMNSAISMNAYGVSNVNVAKAITAPTMAC